MLKNKKVIITICIMLAVLCLVTGYYWYQNRYYIQTEDARISGDVVKVSPQMTGRITELSVKENQYLRENDFIGRLSDLTLSSNSNLDLAIIKAPISGTVIKKIGNIGEMAGPSTPVVMMVNLQKLYIVANIEEDQVNKVREGQPVDFTVDAFPKVKFSGRVLSIGEAANSVFSLLPQQNTGNSFVKVIQRIPVKIGIDDQQSKHLLPGMNVVVKIHVR